MLTDNDGALLLWLLGIMVVIAGIGKLAAHAKPSPAAKVPWTPERAEQVQLAEIAERERRSGWEPEQDEDDEDEHRRKVKEEQDHYWEERSDEEQKKQEDDAHQQRDDYLNS